MTRENIIQKLKEILMNDEYLVLKELVPDLSEETSLVEDFAFDSLQILNFITKIEKKFGFVCETEDLNLDMFEDVSRLVDFIQSKVAT